MGAGDGRRWGPSVTYSIGCGGDWQHEGTGSRQSGGQHEVQGVHSQLECQGLDHWDEHAGGRCIAGYLTNQKKLTFRAKRYLSDASHHDEDEEEDEDVREAFQGLQLLPYQSVQARLLH